MNALCGCAIWISLSLSLTHFLVLQLRLTLHLAKVNIVGDGRLPAATVAATLRLTVAVLVVGHVDLVGPIPRQLD